MGRSNRKSEHYSPSNYSQTVSGSASGTAISSGVSGVSGGGGGVGGGERSVSSSSTSTISTPSSTAPSSVSPPLQLTTTTTNNNNKSLTVDTNPAQTSVSSTSVTRLILFNFLII